MYVCKKFARHDNAGINLFSDESILPEFPLIPASRGFCITLRKTLVTFKRTLIKEEVVKLPDLPEADDSLIFTQENENSPQNQSTNTDFYNRSELEETDSHLTSYIQQQADVVDSLSSTGSLTSITNETKKNSSKRNSS